MSNIFQSDFFKGLNLSEEDQSILKMLWEFDQKTLEAQQKTLEAQYQNKMLTLEKNFQKRETELINKMLTLETEFHKKEVDLILINKEYERQLLETNWESLKQENLLDIRDFIDFFDRKHLHQISGERTERFTKFISRDVYAKTLRKWSLDQNNFKDIFVQLYRKLNSAAHGIFNINGKLEIEKNQLDTMELHVIGFLWEIFPLEKNKLLLKDEKVLKPIFDYIKR